MLISLRSIFSPRDFFQPSLTWRWIIFYAQVIVFHVLALFIFNTILNTISNTNSVYFVANDYLHSVVGFRFCFCFWISSQRTQLIITPKCRLLHECEKAQPRTSNQKLFDRNSIVCSICRPNKIEVIHKLTAKYRSIRMSFSHALESQFFERHWALDSASLKWTVWMDGWQKYACNCCYLAFEAVLVFIAPTVAYSTDVCKNSSLLNNTTLLNVPVNQFHSYILGAAARCTVYQSTEDIFYW